MQRSSICFAFRLSSLADIGNAVLNTVDLYTELGVPATEVQYFDQCNPDGSRKRNSTVDMCFKHVRVAAGTATASSLGTT